MVSEFHKELLASLVKDWTIQQIEEYIIGLEKTRTEMEDWIKYLKTLKKKKTRKHPVDTGVRGGS